METTDINVRGVAEETRRRFNVLKHTHGADSQREILRDLIKFAENNPEQFKREVINVERDRKHRP